MGRVAFLVPSSRLSGAASRAQAGVLVCLACQRAAESDAVEVTSMMLTRVIACVSTLLFDLRPHLQRLCAEQPCLKLC